VLALPLAEAVVRLCTEGAVRALSWSSEWTDDREYQFDGGDLRKPAFGGF
jgi:hypothetical protein